MAGMRVRPLCPIVSSVLIVLALVGCDDGGSLNAGQGAADGGGPAADGSTPPGDGGAALDAGEPGDVDATPHDDAGAPGRDAAPGTDAGAAVDARPVVDAAPRPDLGPLPDGGPSPEAFSGGDGTILFVTQVPVAGFNTVTSTFANHLPVTVAAPRGGDLWIRYPDGALRNLTREAGYGQEGVQTDRAIAVREPSVHWSGQRAVFSMVVGSNPDGFHGDFQWQLYEVWSYGPGEQPVIRKVRGQPTDYNNVSPTYGSDDRILFVSDRPRDGSRHHYPLRDEYEGAPTISGVWSLDPISGDLFLMNHAPSGVFSPVVDSAGRVVFVQWDHLQRDQLTESPQFGAFTYADESADAARLPEAAALEVFPEARTAVDPAFDPNRPILIYNQFFLWELNQDGTAHETLNHVGRHEWGGSYTDPTFLDDRSLTDSDLRHSRHANTYDVYGGGGLFHVVEDPTQPGRFYATASDEFGSASAGAIVRLDGAKGQNPEEMRVEAVTAADCRVRDDVRPAPASTGHYRDPLPMSDGSVIAAHTPHTGSVRFVGDRRNPRWDFEFRLKRLVPDGDLWRAGEPLTEGIRERVEWFDPDVRQTYDGVLWELEPVEVRPQPAPPMTVAAVDPVEAATIEAAGVDLAALQGWLRQNDLALVVSRNVTYRDRNDKQQPFNLRVPGGVETRGDQGRLYDVAFMQFFQADALRGLGGVADPLPGRRVLARAQHGLPIEQVPEGAPDGAVAIAPDGSVAAFVHARRAMSWQLVAPDGTAIVRERSWVSFQPGEIRSCPACHGINTVNQAGQPPPDNPPEALRLLLEQWRDAQGG